jgi:hypothetical protein
MSPATRTDAGIQSVSFFCRAPVERAATEKLPEGLPPSRSWAERQPTVVAPSKTFLCLCRDHNGQTGTTARKFLDRLYWFLLHFATALFGVRCITFPRLKEKMSEASDGKQKSLAFDDELDLSRALSSRSAEPEFLDPALETAPEQLRFDPVNT